MVLHLLASGSGGAKKGSSRKDQIPALPVKLLIYQKVFLFRADGGRYMGHSGIAENMENLDCLLAQGLHRAQQRGLFIQGFSPVGAEGCGNVKGAVFNKSRGSRIPCGIASGFKGSPQSPGGKTGGVRFPFYQFLSGKIHDDLTVFRGSNKAVVLFSGEAGHRLEPVGEMGGAVFHCPLFHSYGYGIRHLQFQVGAVLNGFFQSFINIFGKLIPHDFVIKYQAPI